MKMASFFASDITRVSTCQRTIAPNMVRFMTHVDVDDAGVERVRKAVSAAP